MKVVESDLAVPASAKIDYQRVTNDRIRTATGSAGRRLCRAVRCLSIPVTCRSPAQFKIDEIPLSDCSHQVAPHSRLILECLMEGRRPPYDELAALVVQLQACPRPAHADADAHHRQKPAGVSDPRSPAEIDG